jgi:AcrR family transcriptional regulator
MSDSPTGRQRDRGRTERKLVEAAIGIIREEGFAGLGVNAVAERAGVSKVLIYRYFGDLDGLYRAVAEAVDPLQSRTAERMLDDIDDDASVEDVVRRMVRDLHAALSVDELTKQLLIWELSHENAITRAFSAARERTGLELTERFRTTLAARDDVGDLDVNALLALLTAGVFYLTLRSERVDSFNGVDIATADGWDRLAGAVARLVAGPGST